MEMLAEVTVEMWSKMAMKVMEMRILILRREFSGYI